MIVSNCPRCAEVFRIPDAEMPDDAYAQCPWCNETFPIVEVLHRLPPVLHIVSADGETLEFSPQRSAVAGTAGGGSPGVDQGEYYDGGIGSLIEDHTDDSGNKTVSEETVAETWTDIPADRDGSSTADFDIEDPNDTWEEAAGVVGDAKAITPMKVTPAPVMSRKSKGSSLRTMISIVLGGLAAGPAAIAILWVLTLFGVEVDLGFWPLNGHSAVAGTDRVAAAPATLSADRTPSATGRSLIDDTDNDSVQPDLQAAGGIGGEGEDPATAAAREIAGDAGLRDDIEAPQPDLGDATAISDDSPNKSVMPDAIETPDSQNLASDPAVGRAEPDSIEPPEATTKPSVDLAKRDAGEAQRNAGEVMSMPTLGSNKIAPVAPPGNGETTGDRVPPSDDTPAIAMPDLAATAAANVANLAAPESSQKPPKRTATEDEPTPASIEASPASEPKPAGRTATAETPSSDVVASDVALDSPQPTATAPTVTKPKPSPKPASVARTNAYVEPALDAKPALKTESSEVVEAAELARDMLDQLSSVDRGDAAKTKPLLRDTYIAIARVGAVAVTNSDSVRTLLQRVKASPDLDVWSQAGPAWLELGKRRTTEGVLLVGKPESDARGQRIAMSGYDAVVLTSDSTELPRSKRVLGLGRIVEASSGTSESDSGPTVSLVAVESLP